MDMFAATFCLLCVISGAGKRQNKLSVFQRDIHEIKSKCSPLQHNTTPSKKRQASVMFLFSFDREIKNSLNCARKYARMFVRRHCLFPEGQRLERSSRKTVRFQGQIVCACKYPSIF